MATHQISMLGGNTVPDTTGSCFPELYGVKATNDVWNLLIWVFNDPSSGSHGIYGQFTVPQNYVGTAVVVPVWTSTATSGNCRWTLTYRTVGGDDTTSLDQSGVEETASVTDAAPSAAHERLTPSIDVTDANFAAGETVTFFFARNHDSGTDTMAAAAILFDLLFQYADA